MLGSLGESEGGVRERTPSEAEGWRDCSVLVRGWGGDAPGEGTPQRAGSELLCRSV